MVSDFCSDFAPSFDESTLASDVEDEESADEDLEADEVDLLSVL